jgi:hypothetical protein
MSKTGHKSSSNSHSLLPVPMGKLSGIFKDTTTSYKYLFFRGLIGVLEKENFVQTKIPLARLGTEMLFGAWYTAFYFHLQLGNADQVLNCLEKILPKGGVVLSERKIENLLRGSKSIDASQGLLRYVPQRLLTPWFSHELRGFPDHIRNQMIVELSDKYFEERKPLYRISEDEIEMHPDWLCYIQNNYAVLKGWADWQWLDYLARRNPDVPALSKKLEKPGRRSPLTKQRGFWRTSLKSEHFRCIYTDQKLTPDEFDLDHFLPRSFVAHDQLWNLVPTFKSTNSEKNNSLPNTKFLNGLVEMHHRALCITYEKYTDVEWKKIVEPYIADLRLQPEQLLEKEFLQKAFHHKMSSDMARAEMMGFPPDWVPNI